MLKMAKRNIKGTAFMYIFDEGKKQPSPNCRNKFKLIFIGLFIFNVCCNSNNEKKSTIQMES